VNPVKELRDLISKADAYYAAGKARPCSGSWLEKDDFNNLLACPLTAACLQEGAQLPSLDDEIGEFVSNWAECRMGSKNVAKSFVEGYDGNTNCVYVDTAESEEEAELCDAAFQLGEAVRLRLNPEVITGYENYQ
jgi:hypothetical protein